MSADLDLCRLTSSALVDQFQTINQLNKKFYALRRIGELMATAANPLAIIPGITTLLPIKSINLALYENLRAHCPALNLPSGVDGLLKLQNELAKGYNRIMGMLFNHPWNRLSWLQRQMDRITCQSLVDPSKIQGWLNCANAACMTAAGLPDALRNQQASLNEFNQNFVSNPTGVMTQGMAQKNQQVKDLITYVDGLTAK